MQREAEDERMRMAEEARKREDAEAITAAEGEKRRAEANRDSDAEAAASIPLKRKQSMPSLPPSKAAGGSDEPSEQAEVVAEDGTPSPAPRRFTPVARPEVKKPDKKKAKDDKRPAASARAWRRR